MTVALDAPATTLEGPAACDVPEGAGPAFVGTVRAQDLGRVGGHRVFAWVELVLEDAEPGTVSVDLGQGMENLPPDAGLPEYGGLTGPAGVESRTDGTQGTITFTQLPSGERGFVGDGWPAAISGRISWTCDLIPSAPTPPPAGAVGTAVLSGALSATFAASGGDCPTVENPDGFMTGSALLNDTEAILNVTIDPSGETWFVLYRTPGDREDEVAARGRAPVEADEGGGWRVRLAAVPTEIGPVTLELRWRCER
jgi:hypothetical protein